MVAAAADPRRAAVGGFLFACLVMAVAVYIGLVWHGDISSGSEWVIGIDFYAWVILFSLILALTVAFLVLLYRRAGAPAPASLGALPIECTNCATRFDVQDTGVRPLDYTCPQCGTAGSWTAEPVPMPGAGPAGVGASEEALLVKCTNCGKPFELPFSDKRPIFGSCPNCGKRGILPAASAEGGVPVLQLEGIGPAFAERLNEAGIYNSEQLRQADLDALSAATDIPLANLESWRAMSDLIRIKGIGPQYAEVLARAGIKDAKDLAKQTPKKLTTTIREYLEGLETNVLGTGVDEVRVRGWIRAAKSAAKKA